MILQRLQVDGRRCVAIEEREYRRLARLESGKHSPTIRTVEKIERALQQAQARVSRSCGR